MRSTRSVSVGLCRLLPSLIPLTAVLCSFSALVVAGFLLSGVSLTTGAILSFSTLTFLFSSMPFPPNVRCLGTRMPCSISP